MGIDIGCDKCTYSCSYGRWYEFRVNMILATHEYLKLYYENNKPKEDSTDYEFQKDLNNFFNKINIKDKMLGLFIDHIDINILNILIHYNLYGIYALCYKSDDDGYYSVGNAYDICEIIPLIRPFYNKISNANNMHIINEVEKIFKESVEKRRKICIY